MSILIWHVRAEAEGCLRSWGDDGSGVFYCAGSGDTHLLDALAMELHDLLRTKPMSQAQLLQALSDVIEPGCEAEAVSQLHDHLKRLQDIGLLCELPV